MAWINLVEFMAVIAAISAADPKYQYPVTYMDKNCKQTIDVSNQKAGIVYYTQSGDYPPRAYCYLTLDAGRNKFLILTVKFLDIEYHPSCKDKLSIYDGSNKNPAKALSGRNGLCGSTAKVKKSAMYSTQTTVTLEFESNSGDDQGITHKGFEIIYTIFEYTACKDGLSCPEGGRCISKVLQCDGYDNCGKRADEIVPGRQCPVSSGKMVTFSSVAVLLPLLQTFIRLFRALVLV